MTHSALVTLEHEGIRYTFKETMAYYEGWTKEKYERSMIAYWLSCNGSCDCNRSLSIIRNCDEDFPELDCDNGSTNRKIELIELRAIHESDTGEIEVPLYKKDTTHFDRITKSPESLAKWFCVEVCGDKEETYREICADAFRELTTYSFGDKRDGAMTSIVCECTNLNDDIKRSAAYKWLTRNVEDDVFNE